MPLLGEADQQSPEVLGRCNWRAMFGRYSLAFGSRAGPSPMAFASQLPTSKPGSSTRLIAPGVRGVLEVAGVIASAILLSLLSQNMAVGFGLVGLLLGVACIGLLFSRTGVLVFMAVESMWFDSVGIGPMRIGRIVTVLFLATILFRIAGTGWRPPALLARAWMPFAVFYGWAFLSGFWSPGAGVWLQGMAELFLGVSYGLIFLFFLESEKQLELAVRVFTWIGIPIASASYVIFRAVKDDAKDLNLEARVSSFNGNANAYAGVLMATLPMATLFYRRAKSRNERLVYLAVIGAMLAALISTGSRSGLIVGGVVGAYIFTTMPGIPRRRRIWVMLVGGLAMIVAVFVAAALNPERYSFAAFFGDGGGGRLDLWNAALQMFNQHPVQGAGLGAFRLQIFDALSKVSGGSLNVTKDAARADASSLEVHNMYFTLLLDLGVIGLALYLLSYFTVAKNLWDLRKTQWKDWAWVFGGIHLATLFGGMFGSSYNAKMNWTVLGVSGAAYYRRSTTDRIDRERSNVGLGPLPKAGETEALAAGGDQRAARMDLRTRYPFAPSVLAVFILAAGLGYSVGTVAGKAHYSTNVEVFAVNLDSNATRFGVQLTDARLQNVLNTARSDPYLEEIRRQAGLSESVEELREYVDSTRPLFSAIIHITANTPSAELTRRIGAVLLPSLDAVVERNRESSYAVLGEDGRNVTPDDAVNFAGPLYLRVFGPTGIDEFYPRASWYGFLSGLSAVIALMILSMYLHDGRQLTSREDIEAILGVRRVATLPRPRFGRTRNAQYHLESAAETLTQFCPDGVAILGVASPKLSRLHSWTAVGLAGGMALEANSSVVVADVSGRLSKQLLLNSRKGLGEVAAGTCSLHEVAVPLRGWRRLLVPRSYHKLIKATGATLFVAPLGKTPLDSAGWALAEALENQKDQFSTIVCNLPQIPGPMSVRSLLDIADANLVAVLDGWTSIEETEILLELVTTASPDRVGLVLIDN